MEFTVLQPGTKLDAAKLVGYLLVDPADDRNRFTTQYTLIVYDSASSERVIGSVKIGQTGLPEGRAKVPEKFTTLGADFFSLGQDDSYYANLTALGKQAREVVLKALKDIAFDPKLYTAAQNEKVTRDSLLRLVTSATAQGQFRRLAQQGGERLTPYKFKYTAPPIAEEGAPAGKPVEVTFEVDPDSNPPSNIHVLIGPNGVGKTHLLEMMARALTGAEVAGAEHGEFQQVGKNGSFAGVVSVTFSAFDPFDPLPDRRGDTGGIRYSYVGLKSTSKGVAKGTLQNLKLLTGEFGRSLESCSARPKADRWRKAVKTLEADPIFKQNNVSSLLDPFGEDEELKAESKQLMAKLRDQATELFLKLSTGHKIVLLTITRLVETVEERTLVLFDEPESHLHPPLLSSFIRALSDLLIDRNGVAVLATHSPVVLQEVPKECSWKLRRAGGTVIAERPQIETFGENVGVLTRDVFKLEVTQSGFYKLLQESADAGENFDAIMTKFSKKLGGEARAIVRALIATRNADETE